MKKIYNFIKINNLLDFPSEDTFYVLQIIKRRKENPEMITGEQVIRRFYLYNKTELLALQNKIEFECERNNARAYINLNKRSHKHIANMMLKGSLELVIAGHYKALKTVYDSTCLKHSSDPIKKWVIDIDIKDLTEIEKIKILIESLQNNVRGKASKEFKVLELLETLNGYHLITNPFNLQEFNKTYNNKYKIEVKKNALTVLYYNSLE